MKAIISIFLILFSTYYASAQKVINIYPQKGVQDYTPIIQNAVEQMRPLGGGEIVIQPGSYPMHSSIYVVVPTGQFSITIRGVANSKGEYPLLLDTELGRKPHKFFYFGGAMTPVSNLSVSISNLRILGNNIPYSAQHPFYGAAAAPENAISAANIRKFAASNLIIKNIYGGGIMVSNSYFNNDDKLGRSLSPSVRNVKIIDCWNDNLMNNGGDGIMMWSVKNPIIENCTIVNNMDRTKGYARCGIVLEKNTENGIIRNNTISGYDRGIHIECDYGGHKIENNRFAASYVAIIFSEDCGQDKNKKDLYSPSIVSGNTFTYLGELEKNNIVRNDWGFIYIYKASFVLDGLVVKNNVFKTTQKAPGNKPLFQKKHSLYLGAKKVYMRLDTQKNVTLSNNRFE